MELPERSVLEAISWRLASELMRRHPDGLRLFRGHSPNPNYDLLWIRSEVEPGVSITLNRTGSIDAHSSAPDVDGLHATWNDYLVADPKDFVERLERAARLPHPAQVPPSTPATLTFRVLAALASLGMKSVHPTWIEQGCIDSPYGGSTNERLRLFSLPTELTAPRRDDLLGEFGYRFWIPVRDDEPLAVLEHSSGTAWFRDGGPPLDLLASYRALGKEPSLVAAEILRRSLGLGSA